MPGQEELRRRCPGTSSTLKRNLEALVEHGSLNGARVGRHALGDEEGRDLVRGELQQLPQDLLGVLAQYRAGLLVAAR